MKKLFILDYDNTIAHPKKVPSEKMKDLLSALLEENMVAILTAGRSIKGLRELFVSDIQLNNSFLLSNILLCPKYGNLVFEYEDGWFVLYEAPNIAPKEKGKIERVLRRINWKKYIPHIQSKQRIHDKGAVISINCLGNMATEEERNVWDPDGIRRKNIKREISKKLGEKYDIFITGRNTIDIVPKGGNKADNILKLSEITSIPLENCIYIGDEFEPDGNDYSILSLGIKVYKVNSPLETEIILKKYI